MMKTLTITIQLDDDGLEDGYDAFQEIAKSNIPHNRGEDGEGEFMAHGDVIGSWKIEDGVFQE